MTTRHVFMAFGYCKVLQLCSKLFCSTVKQVEGQEGNTKLRRSSGVSKFGWSWKPTGSLRFQVGMHARVLSLVRLFVTLWTVARQAPLSMGFSRQERWSGLLWPLPADLTDPCPLSNSHHLCLLHHRWILYH